MVVDGEGGNLLDQLEEIHRRVEKRWLELAFQIYVIGFGFRALDVLRDVDQSSDMDRKLTEDRTDNVEVENVVLRAFFG